MGEGRTLSSLPKCPESEKAAAFAEIWNETFAPLHDWLRNAALSFGRHVANAYEAYRLAEAVMTYDDQVRLALRALDHPAVRRELAAERLSVLLDEAQDTDPGSSRFCAGSRDWAITRTRPMTRASALWVIFSRQSTRPGPTWECTGACMTRFPRTAWDEQSAAGHFSLRRGDHRFREPDFSAGPE